MDPRKLKCPNGETVSLIRRCSDSHLVFMAPIGVCGRNTFEGPLERATRRALQSP